MGDGLALHPGPLLGKTFELAEGVRVRLRLAHFSDWPSIAHLMTDHGAEPAQAGREARRLVDSILASPMSCAPAP